MPGRCDPWRLWRALLSQYRAEASFRDLGAFLASLLDAAVFDNDTTRSVTSRSRFPPRAFHEEDLPAKGPTPQEAARLPSPHAYPRRPLDPEEPA